jgi:hypothetical protein
MKAIFLIFFVCYSSLAFSAPNKNMIDGYQNFLKETNKLRIDQELKIYKKQQEFLTKFFKQKMIHLKEISKMQESLEWGNKENNKKIMAMIEQKKKAFKLQTKSMRQEFFKNELKLEIENFNLKMRQRKQAFGKSNSVKI